MDTLSSALDFNILHLIFFLLKGENIVVIILELFLNQLEHNCGSDYEICLHKNFNNL